MMLIRYKNFKHNIIYKENTCSAKYSPISNDIYQQQ